MPFSGCSAASAYFGAPLPALTSPVTLVKQPSPRYHAVICCCSEDEQKRAAPKPPSIFTRREALARSAALASAAALPAVPAAAAPAPFCGVTETVPSFAYSLPWEERLVDFHRFRTWTRKVGKDPNDKGGFFGLFQRKINYPKAPLLCLHGGPGLPSRYLESLELLAGNNDRQVIFYDQAGCGYSLRASTEGGPATGEMSMDLLLEELHTVRQALSLDRCHLFGHGWGGMLALAAMTNGEADGIISLTLASTCASTAAMVQDRQARARELSEDMASTLLNGERDEPAFAQALQEYNRQFVCRKTAGCVQTARSDQSQAVQQALFGPTPFRGGGELVDWDVEGRLGNIKVQTLVTLGEFDEVSQRSARTVQQGIPGAQLTTFKGTGSYMHIDAADLFLTRLDNFLSEVEQAAVPHE